MADWDGVNLCTVHRQVTGVSQWLTYRLWVETQNHQDGEIGKIQWMIMKMGTKCEKECDANKV